MFTFVVHAWKSWKSAKAVGLLAATALAAGIGSATAIYTVIDAVLIKPVPWQHSERFLALFSARLDNTSKGEWASTSWLDLVDYQQRTRSFDAFGVFLPREFSLTSPGQPQHLTGVEVTPSFAQSLGVSPLVGRWFGETAKRTGQRESGSDFERALEPSGERSEDHRPVRHHGWAAVHSHRGNAGVVSIARRLRRRGRIPNRRLGAPKFANRTEGSRLCRLLLLRQAQAGRIACPS